MRLKPYYEKPAKTAEEVKSSELTDVKLESGSGSEKENEVKVPQEKKRKRVSSSDSESQEDPDFELKPKSTKGEDGKKEIKEKKRDKDKEKKKKDKDRDRERDKLKSKDYERHKTEKYREKIHHSGHSIKEKSEKSESKLSYKLTEPQSFEKLISESASGGKKSEKSVDSERRNMSQLFPGQHKAESVKKKLALTPHTSPKLPHQSSSSSLTKSPYVKSGDSHLNKKPEPSSTSPVKKILNFDNPSRNVNILDQIMSTMSFPANKE